MSEKTVVRGRDIQKKKVTNACIGNILDSFEVFILNSSPEFASVDEIRNDPRYNMVKMNVVNNVWNLVNRVK